MPGDAAEARPGCGSSRRCRCRARTSTSPAATAAPLPPLEPPVRCAGVPRVSRRPEVRARRRGAVGELVRVELADDRPRRRARSRATTSRPRAGTLSARIFDAAVVGVPATSITSLTATGRREAARRSGSASASASASSARTVMKELSASSALDPVERVLHRLARRELTAGSPLRARRGHVASGREVEPGGGTSRPCAPRARAAREHGARKPSTPSRSASVGSTPCTRARARSSSSVGSGVDSPPMPIYEYRCEACGERSRSSSRPRPSPRRRARSAARAKVERLLSQINTEWLPSDVAWDRVGRSWD